jgi:hypothetical protein
VYFLKHEQPRCSCSTVSKQAEHPQYSHHCGVLQSSKNWTTYNMHEIVAIFESCLGCLLCAKSVHKPWPECRGIDPPAVPRTFRFACGKCQPRSYQKPFHVSTNPIFVAGISPEDLHQSAAEVDIVPATGGTVRAITCSSARVSPEWEYNDLTAGKLGAGERGPRSCTANLKCTRCELAHFDTKRPDALKTVLCQTSI